MNKFHKGPNEERSPNVIATLYSGETGKIYFLFLCTCVSLRVTNSIPSCINFSNVSPCHTSKLEFHGPLPDGR